MKPEQITAWALNEASAEERQQLEAALQGNPQDKLKADETKAFCDFLLNELRDDSLALTDKQRERLVAQAAEPTAGETPARFPDASGTPALGPPRKGETRWNMVAIARLAVAACAVLGGFWTWQVYSTKTHTEVQQTVAVAEKPGIKVQLPQKPEMKKKAGEEARLLAAVVPKPVIVPQAPSAKPLAPAAAPAAVAAGTSALALNKDQRTMAPADVERLKRVQDERAYGLSFGGVKGGLPSAAEPPMPLAARGATASNSLGQTGTGVMTQRVQPSKMGTSTLVLNGNSSPGSLTMTPGAMALLRQTHERPAASLSLKAGEFPSHWVWGAQPADVMEIDGCINLFRPTMVSTGNGLLVAGSSLTYSRVSPQKTGIAFSLVYRDRWLSEAGWPLMLPANPNLLAASMEPDMEGTLADYRASVDVGSFERSIGSATSQVLKAANSSTGSVMVQAGAPVTMNAIMHLTHWPMIHVMDYKTLMVGSDFVGWTMLDFYENTHSAGLISFARAVSVPFNAAFERGEHLTEGMSDLQAAVFNAPALSKASSDASTVLGSGALVANNDVFISTGWKQPLDLMGPPVVTTKSGTRATTEVTGEFYSAGSIVVENRSSFKFDGSSAAFRPVLDKQGPSGANAPLGSGAVLMGGRVSSAPSQGLPLDLGGQVTAVAASTAGTRLATTTPALVLSSRSDAAGANALGTQVLVLNGGTMVNHGGNPNVTGAGTGDLILGAKVTTKSGTKATMTVEREHVYPAVAGTMPAAASATGATAAVFGTALSPQVVEFNGFANDATPAAGMSVNSGKLATATGTVSMQPPASSQLVFASVPADASKDLAEIRKEGGALTINGGGTVMLTDANTYTGATVVNAGTLTVTGGKAIQVGDVSTQSGIRGYIRANGFVTPSVTLTSAGPAPATAPASPPAGIVGGWAATDKDFATFNSTASGVQKPLAGAAGGNVSSATAAPAMPEVMNPEPAAKAGLQLAASSSATGNYDAAITQYQDVLRKDPYNAAARQGMETAVKKRQEYFRAAYDNQRAKMLAQVTETREDKLPVAQAGSAIAYTDRKTDDFYFGRDAMPEERKAERPPQPSAGESYTRIIENEMKEVAREPLSTLSIDVDTASYANVRRFLNQNMIPPPDAVRIEELVNYFPTSEEGPAHDAKEPFGVRVELAPCPWQPVHRLARISIKGREMDKDRKASNLVFLVDVSGSMNEPAKLPLVQQSLRMLTEQLGEGDRVTMVVYAGSSGVVLPPTSGEKKEEILGAINRLSAGGSTHGSAGIKLAYEQAVAGFIKGGVNRVILCTDGDFNVGVSSPEELEKLIKHKAKTGVFLSVLGFGSGNLKDRTMETLADKGNGNYAYIDSLSEARKVLVEQMSGTLVTIAKDVKIQVEFNPAAVRSYRLIGYENRLLAKEDFNDDTKDAGEIGAGHSVVALYEIVPANLPAGAEGRPAVDSLKYQAPAISPAQLAEAAKSGETMTVKLRYKEPESDLSKLIEVPTKDEGKTLTASTEEFKFSAAVAGFGLLLRDSSYKGSLSWETVRRLALDGKGADKQGYRGEFLQLIDKARGLKETR